MLNAFLRLRLGIKFFLSMMLLICGILLGMLYLIFAREKELILPEVERRGLDLTATLAFISGPEMLNNNYVALQKNIDGIKNRPDLQQVMIFNTAGKVLAHCNVSECDKVYADSLTRRILRANGSVVLPVYVSKNESVLDVAAPIFIGANQKVGFARALVSLQRADAAIGSLKWRVLVLGIAGTGVAFILVAGFSRIVTQPLRRLDEKALLISRGERDIQIKVTAQDEIGHLQQALKTMIDEVRLQSRLSALGTTTASLAHEIRTPLIVITRYINELIGQSSSPEIGHKLLGEINQLNDLVKQLLQFSQKSKLTRSRADINELLKQTLFLLAEPLAERQIAVHTDFQALPVIAADKNLLQSVFRNLIDNAVQAMEEKGELHLQTRLLPIQPEESWPVISTASPSPAQLPTTPPGRGLGIFRKLRRYLFVESATRVRRILLAKLPPDKQAIMMTIRDNGCGIPKEIMERLFLPFVTTKKEGTGLGLALSHKIIQEHQGTIMVESEEGFGTTFTILLPT